MGVKEDIAAETSKGTAEKGTEAIPHIPHRCNTDAKEHQDRRYQRAQKHFANRHVMAMAASAEVEPDSDDDLPEIPEGLEGAESDDDAGDPDLDQEEPESKVDRLRKEAKSINHMLTHHPKNPFCTICRYSKAQAQPARRIRLEHKRAFRKFGECVTADHAVLGKYDTRGLDGEHNGLLIQDLGSQWIDFSPTWTKNAQDPNERT